MSETDSRDPVWVVMADDAVREEKPHVALIGSDGTVKLRFDAIEVPQAMVTMRTWLRGLLDRAYKTGFAAGHVAGLDDLSRITAPVGTPLDEVADLRREVTRLTRERDDARLDAERLTAEVTRLRVMPKADAVVASAEVAAAVERGRIKGWQEAIAAAEAESTEAVRAMQEADRVAEKAADDAVRCRNEAVGAATVADTLRRAAPKVTA